MSTNTYNAAIYVRLSKEDGDKSESDSIGNQRDLIKDFLKSMPDICLCSERVDDGYSGVDFLRPGFQAMIEDIRAGKINCVIVKDFSRFGRNYIEVGKYLENIFPFLGVRFISVNDHYDSAKKNADSDYLIVPFKNLINDAYSRDISVKIRSQLAIKRKKGDFIGNFVVYGYLKNPDNKNKLVIDDYAAGIVRNIFQWKIEGLSQQGIANRLNNMGELSPLEYKHYHGVKINSNFKKKSRALWTAVAVGRILKNPIYTGTLEQGKVTTPNHKLKNLVYKPRDEWAICENTHEAIIPKHIFDSVLGILSSDTRVAPLQESAYLFSGLLFCADCGNSMVRKTIPYNGKKYFYYVCSTKKNGGNCTLHNTSEISLIEIMLSLIKKYIENILDMEKMLVYINSIASNNKEVQKLSAGLTFKNDEIEKYQKLKLSVYEDFKEGILGKQEYIDFNQLYTGKLSDAEIAATKIKSDIDILLNDGGESQKWIKEFVKYHNITELSRKILTSLVDSIKITEDGIVDVTFLYNDKFQATVELIANLSPAVDTSQIREIEVV